MTAPTPQFIKDLESWYTPSWSVYSAISDQLDAFDDDIQLVLDAGCGNGTLAPFVTDHDLDYIGFDTNRSVVRAASRRYRSNRVAFFESAQEAVQSIPPDAQALLVSAFSSHEMGQDLLSSFCEQVRRVILWDLSPKDLPRLHDIAAAAGTANSPDPRYNIDKVVARLTDLGWAVSKLDTTLEVRFPDEDSVLIMYETSTYLMEPTQE